MAAQAEPLYARGFAADAQTERALQTGLAGRKVEIRRERWANALRTLAAAPASRLVFFDLDGHPDPQAAARELTGVCAPEIALIAIGSADSADLVRALLRQGVADYLVKPVSAALVREAGAAALDDMPRRAHAGRVVAFAGSAGSGCSTLVAAIARSVAGEERTVSALDLDPLAGRLARAFDAAPGAGLSELLTALAAAEEADTEAPLGADRLDGVCGTAAPGLSLVAYPAAGALPPPPSPAAVAALVGHLANRTHLVLVAGIRGLDTEFEIMRQADARVLLFEPTLPSVSAAVRRLALLGAEGPATLVQSAPRMPKGALSPAHIRYVLGDRRPDVVVPSDPAPAPAPHRHAPAAPGAAPCARSSSASPKAPTPPHPEPRPRCAALRPARAPSGTRASGPHARAERPRTDSLGWDALR